MNDEKMEQSREEPHGRRDFLRQTAIVAGGLVVGTATLRVADAAQGDAAEKKQSDIVLKLNEHKELATVGGFEVMATNSGKIIVAHTDENSFVACSAICTHRGCEVGYDHGTKQFACPCHGARFSLDGQVVRGPAKKPLQSYSADAVAVVHLGET